jgi:uncharacterized surface protein with fasciclin (FAS1) repeats
MKLIPKFVVCSLASVVVLASVASAQTSSLVAQSTRSGVGTGNLSLISGFAISAPEGQLRWVLVRGVGPTLASFGVANPLADPTIQIRSSNGTVIATNDNFATAPNLALLNTVSAAVGAFPITNPNEAAVLVGVPAGGYTALLSGVGATDVRPGLVEVYEFGAVGSGANSQSIAGLAASNPNLSTLATALRLTGLDAVLAAGGPFTVFAPTNAAFAALPSATLNALLADPAALAQVLLFHVASGQVLSSQLTNNQNVTTLRTGARPLVVNLTGGVRIDRSNVIAADVRATNGVVHVIDAVLLP